MHSISHICVRQWLSNPDPAVFHGLEQGRSVPPGRLSPFQLHSRANESPGQNNSYQDSCYSQICFTLTHNRVEIGNPKPYNDEQGDACNNSQHASPIVL
jgi:hypothetical protein